MYGCNCENRLMVADPKALQYILHTSGYSLPKTSDASHTIRPNIDRKWGWLHERRVCCLLRHIWRPFP
ncbi:hypothetical protein EDB83DRAFT_2366347 [Lactarius deliciosus]|nr:hypothetical protein EDB83DRAFT_2366347 [Lactarius deliciosus]